MGVFADILLVVDTKHQTLRWDVDFCPDAGIQNVLGPLVERRHYAAWFGKRQQPLGKFLRLVLHKAFSTALPGEDVS